MNIKELGNLKTKENKKSNYIYIIRGIIISILITIICLLIFSIILTKSNISEDLIFPVVTIITAISILIGSFFSVGKMKNKGIINGAVVGFSYIIAIYLFSSFVINDFSLNLQSFIMIVCATVGGMIGGILGVNLLRGERKV